MENWECKSRLINNVLCKYSCKVQADFEPKGCLYNALYQKWEIANPIENQVSQPSEPSFEGQPCFCGSVSYYMEKCKKCGTLLLKPIKIIRNEFEDNKIDAGL